MIFYKICYAVLLIYFSGALIVLVCDLIMEYIQQKQNEITRYHSKPTPLTVIRKLPAHLRTSFLWPAYITRYL